MSIIIHPELESKLRARAQAEGISVEAYLERVIEADEQAEEEIESLALEGLNSESR
jgi:predicted HicB family RNase H-like nuclease